MRLVRDGCERSLPTSLLSPISPTFLPVTNQTFAHQGVLTLSILVESGRLTGHRGDYMKDVWWVSLAGPQIAQISSDAEPKASVWRLGVPEKCCKAGPNLLHQWGARPHLIGSNVSLAGRQNFRTKKKRQKTCHFKVNDEEKVITETISKVSAPSNAVVLQLC